MIAIFLISKSEGGARISITIDGDLVGDHVDLAANCCDQAMSSGKPVDIFLHDVLAVDDAGRALLCRLVAIGVSLHAKGVYTSYLVETLINTTTPAAHKGRLPADPPEHEPKANHQAKFEPHSHGRQGGI